MHAPVNTKFDLRFRLRRFTFALLCFASLGSGACLIADSTGENPAALVGLAVAPDIRSINGFTLRAQDNTALSGDAVGIIDQSARTITVLVPLGTDVSSLVPMVEYQGAGVEPPSGMPANFSGLLPYTVTAEDGSRTDYLVRVKAGSASDNSINVFTFRAADNPGLTADVNGLIFESIGLITAAVPAGPTLSALVPSIAVNGETITPASGTAADFTNPVQYTVTALDGSTREYTVSVSSSASPVKTIDSFSFSAANNPALSFDAFAGIDEANKRVYATVPFNTDVTALRASFGITGKTLSIAGSIQTSGSTLNDFSSPVTYTVTAEDGTGVDYQVIVNNGLIVGGTLVLYEGVSFRDVIRLHDQADRDASFTDRFGAAGGTFSLARAVDGSGDIFAAGSFEEYDGVPHRKIVRINPDGTRDANFNIGTGAASNVNVVQAADDGSGAIYIGGFFNTFNGQASKEFARLLPDGSLDPSFVVGSGFSSTVRAALIRGDGSGDVYVGGQFSSYNGTTLQRILRLNNDGSIDTGFAVTGSGQGFGGTVRVIADAGDGSGDIFVGGSFTSYKGSTYERIIRLNSDGSVDTSFNVGGGVGGGGQGFSGTVYAVSPARDGSGDIYVGGSFSTYRGSASSRIIRLNANGTIDTAFNVGTGFDGTVRAILPEPDGTVFVGGLFDSYKTLFITHAIAKLNADGSLDTSFTDNGFLGSVYAFLR